MFERFTETAIKVVMLAQNEARLLGYNQIESWALLLGCMGLGKLNDHPALHGLNLPILRQAAEAALGRRDETPPIEMPFSTNSQQILEKAWDISREMMRNYVDAEALLIATVKIGATANNVIDTALKIRAEEERVANADCELALRIGTKDGTPYLEFDRGTASMKAVLHALAELTKLANQSLSSDAPIEIEKPEAA